MLYKHLQAAPEITVRNSRLVSIHLRLRFNSFLCNTNCIVMCNMQTALCIVMLIAAACDGLSLHRAFDKPMKGHADATVPKSQYRLFEGDIRVSKSFDPTKRKAVADKGLLWPYGVVPYTVSSKFDSTSTRMFKEAMKAIEDATMVNGAKCIQFVPRTDETNYAYLENDASCWSDLGRLGNGRQLISLGGGCNHEGAVVHELLHTLGFFHEQSRADRDYYVDIHYDNIRKGMEGEFKRYALGTSLDHLQQPYDYDSIMHYHSNSFAKDPSQPTITPKVKLPKGVVLGQRDHLSQIDIKMIQALYGCQSNEKSESEVRGQCKDNLNNCHLYGDYACTELPQWAAENCALTCGVCTKVCEDKISDCDAYGDFICTGKYLPWAERNCAKYCGLGDCQQVTTTPAAIEECKDTISDCADYDKDVCVTHKPWASARCQRFCGFCTTSGESQTVGKATTFRETETTTTSTTTPPIIATSTTPKPTTTTSTTRKPTTIASTTPNPTTTTSTITKSTTIVSTTAKPTTVTSTTPKSTTTSTTSELSTLAAHDNSVCRDTIDDCADYGKSSCYGIYKPWMKVRCSGFCEFCEPPNPKERCADVRSDCADFGMSQCGGIYTSYMKKNCASYCNYC